MSKQKQSSSRREFLKSLAMATAAVPLGVSSVSASPQNTERNKPRNVIFILSDDHRFDFMGFLHKPKFLRTPNMDRMAREGAYLKYATVSTSLCSPSRASILTGQYAHTHGVVDNNTRVPEGTRFFPQDLQQLGWQTAFMGKWHMGHAGDEPRPGFNHWVSFRGQGRYIDPTFNVDGQHVKRKGHVTDLLTEYALNWLKETQKNPDKPFFLYLSHKAVHAMFQPQKRYKGKYGKVEIEYPASMANTEENYRGKPHWVKEQRNSWHGVDYMYHGQMDFDTFYRRYCETLLGVDDSIGKILQYLEDNSLADDTLVIYMGDNGFCLGEHGLIDKRQMYEESMRVPMLAWSPKIIKPGTVVEGLVQNIDVAPTILDVAGMKTPSRMHGRSFLPLLQGRKVPWRDAVFYEYYWEWNFPQTPTVHGIRTDRYKYMHYYGIWDIDELYDLKNDPHEMHNLINVPEYKDLIKKLNARVFDWLEQTNGMIIPLRRTRGGQANKRNPAIKS